MRTLNRKRAIFVMFVSLGLWGSHSSLAAQSNPKLESAYSDAVRPIAVTQRHEEEERPQDCLHSEADTPCSSPRQDEQQAVRQHQEQQEHAR